eukprot:13644017-Alexandrium_andersonii.AAC.1
MRRCQWQWTVARMKSTLGDRRVMQQESVARLFADRACLERPRGVGWDTLADRTVPLTMPL